MHLKLSDMLQLTMLKAISDAKRAQPVSSKSMRYHAVARCQLRLAYGFRCPCYTDSADALDRICLMWEAALSCDGQGRHRSELNTVDTGSLTAGFWGKPITV